MKTIRIGGAASYFSDSITSVPQLLGGSPAPDYLIFDFMAEGTITRLAHARAKDPESGFEADFVNIHLAENLEAIVASGVKLVANAGALNPAGCAREAQRLLDERGVPLKVAYVEGDDLLNRQGELLEAGITGMFDGEACPANVDSITAYLGAFPIARALEAGADIVITGRCADSALALGPLIHEFQWLQNDWDRLAAGTLVGHVIECGCQVTGGTFTDWEDVPGWDDMGFPIAEVSPDGTCLITKPAGTGGLINIGTVAEQLLYETDDPRAYIVPDVVCDFSEVIIRDEGENRVVLSGAKGRPATDSYKVVASHPLGWRASYSQLIVGIDAARKARRQGDALIARGQRLLEQRGMSPFSRTRVDCVGAEAAYGPHAKADHVREVFVRATVDHSDRAAVRLFCRESLSATSGLAPGTTALRNDIVLPVSALFMFLMPKKDVPISVTVDGRRLDVSPSSGQPFNAAELPASPRPAEPPETRETVEVPLIRLAWGRSGEKGNLFNIAVIARRPEYLPYLRKALTAERIGQRFAFLYPADTKPKVSVFDVPGCHAINFVLHDSMEGGLMVSARVDSAAKGMAQQLLELPVTVSASLL